MPAGEKGVLANFLPRSPFHEAIQDLAGRSAASSRILARPRAFRKSRVDACRQAHRRSPQPNSSAASAAPVRRCPGRRASGRATRPRSLAASPKLAKMPRIVALDAQVHVDRRARAAGQDETGKTIRFLLGQQKRPHGCLRRPDRHSSDIRNKLKINRMVHCGAGGLPSPGSGEVPASYAGGGGGAHATGRNRDRANPTLRAARR